MGKEIDFRQKVDGAKAASREESPALGLSFDGPPMDAAAVQAAEAAGARLIAGHWLAGLGDLGASAISADFLDRFTEKVAQVIAKGWGPYGPRRYEVKRHNPQRRQVPFDKRNTLLMRYKAGFELFSRFTENGEKVVIAPFDPKIQISKPRHATHYRFFYLLGAICDFDYSPEVGHYVPVRPDLLDLCDSVYSPTLTIDGETIAPIEMAVDLPGLPLMGPKCTLVRAFGVEFLHWGKGKVVPRVEMRVGTVF
jgi:hypothetical protein